jgi:estrogen-related receptor beta like 1
MANKPQIDTYLIMDDVIEKLSLLDYENQFCKGWKHKKISRVYYAHPPGDGEDELQRVHMLYDMIYWLISLNKDMVKKQGVFINFKDFKGKTVDALTKMINDLKKFGLPNVKNLKIENLRSGYGEVVCQLIDELVNMELYRREFEFGTPQIPDDDADEQSEEEDADDAKDEQFAGKNEIINGIEI